jgi:hypothetical protein
MSYRPRFLIGLFLSLLLHTAPGWTQSKNLAPGFTRLQDQAKVVIMPADVELFSISAGGVQEPRADWTEQAQKHLQQELLHQRSNLARQVSPLKAELHDPMAELNGLHGAVAQSIFLHHIQGISKLPTKNGELRWTLGEAVKDLRDQTQADYALFVWIRDSYASAERKAAMIAMAFLGVGLTGGAQVGYASLVNLKDGQVVWFNALMRASGDLREPQAAEETVQVLLRNFPRAP